jgi:uncharacterized protein
MSTIPSVVDNESANRLELTVDGHLAQLQYRLDGDRMVLVHTEVPAELEGQGIGGALVRAAIDRAQAGLTVVPQCPFARQWLQRHGDVASRVTIEWPDEDDD